MNPITSTKTNAAKPLPERQPDLGTTPLNTQTLFPNGSKERTIVHDNTEYRLRITALGKLILTK